MSKYLREATYSERTSIRNNNSILLSAQLSISPDTIVLTNIINQISLDQNHFWLRLCYINDRKISIFLSNHIDPIIYLPNTIKNINEFLNVIEKFDLNDGKLSQFYLHQSFLGIIVSHSIIDGKHLVNTFNLICSFLYNQNIYTIQPSNNKLLFCCDYLPQIPSIPVFPQAIFPYNVKYNDNLSNYVMLTHTINKDKYHKLEYYIDYIKSSCESIHCGPASVLITLLGTAFNKAFNKNTRTLPILCAMDVEPYFIDCPKIGSIFLSKSLLPINVCLENSFKENCISNAYTIFNCVRSNVPISTLHVLNSKKCKELFHQDELIKSNEMKPILVLSSIGNFDIPYNIISGPFIGNKQPCFPCMVVLSSIHSRKKKEFNFSFYVNKGMEKNIKIFKIFIELLNSLNVLSETLY